MNAFVTGIPMICFVIYVLVHHVHGDFEPEQLTRMVTEVLMVNMRCLIDMTVVTVAGTTMNLAVS